jgi:hypothetical protein
VSEINIAAKRPAIFYTAPYYPGITGPDDATQLTDGAVQTEGDYQSPGWVGWGMQAPLVFVGMSLERPSFVSQVRIHTVQGLFPIASVQLFEAEGTARTLVSTVFPPRSDTRTEWLSIPVNQRLSQPIIQLQPTDVADRYIFIDEIQLLATDVYEASGEFVSAPVHLLGRSKGHPTLVGDLPQATSAELQYRRAGTEQWRVDDWDARYFDAPVQFRIVLRASPDRLRTPTVSHIRLGDH